MTANTHYSLTYKGDSSQGDAEANTNVLSMKLIADGKVEHMGGMATARPVDLLTVYFTYAGASYPSPPETFTLTLDNGGNYGIKSIHRPSGATATIEENLENGKWKLTITGPTTDEISDFQLLTPGATPPNKLKIRVKRQPSFTAAGPFDDIWGGEI